MAVDYRRGDFGAYQELACTVPVAIAGRQARAGGLAAFAPALDALARGLARSFTAWIWRMPVSTARARDAGIALAGFPKEVADVRFASDVASVSGGLHAGDGEAAVRLTLPRAEDGRCHEHPRDLRLRSITALADRPVTSLLRIRETRWRDLPRPEGPVLHLGAGELADALRGLDLGERPWFAHHAARAQAVLFPPRNLVDD
jgi:hypothetical protein